jgi:hypothetical protein
MLELGKRVFRTSEINYERLWDERINEVFSKINKHQTEMLLKRMQDMKIMGWHSLYYR